MTSCPVGRAVGACGHLVRQREETSALFRLLPRFSPGIRCYLGRFISHRLRQLFDGFRHTFLGEEAFSLVSLLKSPDGRDRVRISIFPKQAHGFCLQKHQRRDTGRTAGELDGVFSGEQLGEKLFHITFAVASHLGFIQGLQGVQRVVQIDGCLRVDGLSDLLQVKFQFLGQAGALQERPKGRES